MPRQIPWSRVLAEGVVIVISILLAFGIDAGWDRRQDREAADVHLAALAVEVAALREQAEGGVLRRKERMAAMQSLVGAASPGAATIGRDSVELLLGVLWGAWDPLPPLAALNNLHASGVFQAIPSNELRLALAQLERSIDQAARHDERVLRSWEEGLRPYLVTHSDVRPQVRSRPFDLDSHDSVFPLDPTALLGDPVFQNLLLVRMNRTAAALSAARLLLDQLDEVEVLIRGELPR